eukprot:TRINITY_DN748_c0_g1_i3.p1 TRINITY_DN748_c0_g1~~TRINITY_DN748_c0_g1_i3.p1  ORF type:complete len:179 (+),score=30.60 TRINITY_DN748_c0_g1_i3:1100-1636(+)
MGDLISVLQRYWPATKRRRVVLAGLNAAGKTTWLLRIRTGGVVCAPATIGYNIETITHRNVEFTILDLGGQDKIRFLWRQHYANVDGIIFMVDVHDRERLDEAYGALTTMLADELLNGAPLLVFANKQDLPDAMSDSELSARLGLRGLTSRPWHVQACTVTTGNGMNEGLDWLAQTLA